MPSSTDFFGQRNAQAVLKHGVLARYAHYFAGRAGAATQGRVAFIDGYAGEGRYEDGSPGSPLLLASQATRAEMFGREVKLAFVEQDDARRHQLQRSLEENQVEADQILGGSLELVVDGLIDRYERHAILLFVDPFGLAFSRPTLERILGRRTRQQPIDVLYHFSLSAVARMGRAGVLDGPTSGQNAAQLDAALGDINWRADFEGADDPRAPTRAALAVATRFGQSVGTTAGLPSTGVPVRQRPGQLPKYVLMLFSADPKAHWDYADVAGKAHVDWLHHCDRTDYEANIQRQEEAGLLPLFQESEPDKDEIEQQIRRDSLAYLARHITELLRSQGSLRPIDAVQGTYGDQLGLARATHVRSALKELHRQGVITDDATGDFWTRTILQA
jgi:three-Cys-motif partner protein